MKIFSFSRKVRILSLLLLLVSTTAWGQEFDVLKYENPEATVKSIGKSWAKTPLKVAKTGNMNRNFAKAFCSQYPKYAPNAAMLLYLKNTAKYDPNKDHYYVDDAPKNGYIKCDMMAQCDYMTEICYWKRQNGHSLVGVLLQVGHEGEGTKTDYAMLFYDYNPSTGTMTPDTKMYQTVKNIVAKHRGCANFTLPKEGKDIEVYYIYFTHTDEYDFIWEDCRLKWGNNTFKEIKEETGTF